MKLLTALKLLQEVGVPVMQTRDVAYKLGVSNEHASQILRRLVLEKHIVHLSRSLWALDPQMNPFLLPDYLVAPLPCYVSLQTALYHHNMIDQIPRLITVVSLARTRRIQTPLATVSVHHIIPEFFFDYHLDPKTQVKMATPEKALLDIFYLKPARSQWFKTLPEVEIPPSFNVEKAFSMIQRIPSKARRTLVEKALRSFLSRSIE
jgi:predicted transcriptional regulator of viral defense system